MIWEDNGGKLTTKLGTVFWETVKNLDIRKDSVFYLVIYES